MKLITTHQSNLLIMMFFSGVYLWKIIKKKISWTITKGRGIKIKWFVDPAARALRWFAWKYDPSKVKAAHSVGVYCHRMIVRASLRSNYEHCRLCQR